MSTSQWLAIISIVTAFAISGYITDWGTNTLLGFIVFGLIGTGILYSSLVKAVLPYRILDDIDDKE